MELHFTKMNGLGNDFIMVDDMDHSLELSDEQVCWLCDRHFGIGADGVIFIRPSDRPECAAYMHYINSDGSLAQMCGNGVRCFAKFLVDHRLVAASDGRFIADTLAGPRPILFQTDADGLMTEATVDMGEPILLPSRVPVNLPATAQSPSGVEYVNQTPLESPWGVFPFTCVSMGNPHAICFLDNFETIDDALFPDPANKSLATLNLNMIGAYFENHPAFPEKTNVEFAEVHEASISMRVYERGCGETLACGTGACATNVAAALTERAGRENDLLLRGGTLHICWNEENHVLMTGPAQQSFTGVVVID